MLKVAVPGVPVAGRERAGVVADLDQVPEAVVGLVAVRLVAVVAFQRGHGFQAHGQFPPVGQG